MNFKIFNRFLEGLVMMLPGSLFFLAAPTSLLRFHYANMGHEAIWPFILNVVVGIFLWLILFSITVDNILKVGEELDDAN